jgi:ChrR Cupin-like domain
MSEAKRSGIGVPRTPFDEEPKTAVRERAITSHEEAALHAAAGRDRLRSDVSFTASTVAWSAYPELDGVEYKLLHHDEVTDDFSALVRLAPGTEFPAHHRRGTEEVMVFSGDITVSGVRLGTGDYAHAGSGTCDDPFTTDGGAEFLLTGGACGDIFPV